VATNKLREELSGSEICLLTSACSVDNQFTVSNGPVTFQRTLAVVVVLLLYTPNGDTSAAQASDFGFRFEFAPCGPLVTERLDTFNGVFAANLGGQPAQTVTAPMSLTEAQMSAIYRSIQDIRFFDYPSTFTGVPAGAQEVFETSPAPTYRLEVRNQGAVHTVSWTDAKRKPATADVDRLRDLLSMVRGSIHEHPEFKRLPRPAVACE
jgi:hypothetical protein